MPWLRGDTAAPATRWNAAVLVHAAVLYTWWTAAADGGAFTTQQTQRKHAFRRLGHGQSQSHLYWHAIAYRGAIWRETENAAAAHTHSASAHVNTSAPQGRAHQPYTSAQIRKAEHRIATSSAPGKTLHTSNQPTRAEKRTPHPESVLYTATPSSGYRPAAAK